MRKIKNWELNIPMFLSCSVSLVAFVKLFQTIRWSLLSPAVLILLSLITIHMVMKDLLSVKTNYIATYIVHVLLAAYSSTITGFVYPKASITVGIVFAVLPTIVRLIGRYRSKSKILRTKAHLYDMYIND